MNSFNLNKLLLPLLCSVFLAGTIAVPRAHAGIFSFLKRHIFSHHSGQSVQPKKVSDLSTPKDSKHHKKLAALFGLKHHKNAPALATADGASTMLTTMPDPLVDSSSLAVFARSAPRVGKVITSADEPEYFSPPPSVTNDHAFDGKASWYGPGFAGRRTASGQIFNPGGLTAASRTLPLGSKMLVANPKTGKCCTVTINDRGPYVRGRDLDLSHGAASKIGVTGVSPVVCVAYASNRPPSIDTFAATGALPHSRHTRTHGSAVTQKVSGQVYKLNAGVSME